MSLPSNPVSGLAIGVGGSQVKTSGGAAVAVVDRWDPSAPNDPPSWGGERPQPRRLVCGGFLQPGRGIFVAGGIEGMGPLRQGEVVLGAGGRSGGGTLGCLIRELVGG